MAQQLVVKIVGDTSSLSRSYSTATRATNNFGRSIGAAGRGALAASVSYRGLGRSIAFASGAFLGGAGLISVVKSSSEAASNLNEQTTKSQQIFGSSSKSIEAWGKTTASALGLANDQALEAAGTFGNLFTSVGLATKQNAKLSISLVKLASDLASFNNASPEDALLAIRSGVIGEAEPLRKFGVLLSETRVQQVAMAETGKKTAKELTNQEKVMARVAIILQDTKKAQGDFGRTSGGLANQQRILAANVRDLEGAIGKALNPTILTVTKSLNEWLGRSENQKRLTRDLGDVVKVTTNAIKTAATVFGGFSDAVGGVGNAVKILAGAFLLLKIRAAQVKYQTIAAQLASIGTQAELSRAKVVGLQARLLGLSGKVFAATLVLTIIPHSTLGQNQLNKLGLGFLGKLPGVGPLAQQVAAVENKIGGAIGIDESFPPASNKLVEKLKRMVVQGRLSAADIQALEANGSISSFQADGLLRLLKAYGPRGNRRGKRTGGGGQSQSSAASSAAKDAAEAAKSLGLNLPGSVTGSGSAGPQALPGVAAAIAAKRQAAQFKALGLTGSGDERTPGVKSLRNQLGTLADTVKGTFLDTSKTRGLLSHIRQVLSGGLGAVGRDVRQKVKDILDDLNQQLKDHAGDQTAFRHVAASKLLAGLGLSPDQIRAVRGRIATIGPNGTVPGGSSAAFAGAGGTTYVMNNPTFNGVTDINALEEKLEKRAKSRAHTRRG